MITALFLTVSITLTFHHEIWMDEAYHFLLARDSTSLIELFKTGTQTGHPVLWNSVLFFYKYICPSVIEMQILHCLIAGVCVYLINLYSPFSKFENILISFGYYLVFEYNLIAKNYILGFCLILLALVLFEKKKPLWVITLLLACACNLHLFTLFVSLAFYTYIILKRDYNRSSTSTTGSFFLMALGASCAVLQIIPPIQEINEYKQMDTLSFLSFDRAGRSLGVVCRGLFNIPDFRKPDYWNSSLLFNLNRILCYSLSIVAMFLVFESLKKNKLISFLFFVPIILIMIFVYVMPLATGVRYWGYCYILLIICFWLYKKNLELKTFSKIFFRFILLLQFVVAIPALGIDINRPFSNAKYASKSLEESHTTKHTLFVQSLGLGPSLSAYTNKKVYYPSNKTFESFSYSINNKNYTSYDFLKESIHDMNNMNLDTCILVMNRSLKDRDLKPFRDKYHIQKISSFDGAIITSEDYYLYLVYKSDHS